MICGFISFGFVLVVSCMCVCVYSWIVTDFPQTKAQAELFEALLSGYHAPVVDPSTISKVAPPAPAPPRTEPLASGLDCVFRLNVPHEVLLKRALGHRVDPVTHARYHMDTNPPPMDAAVKARLVPPPGQAEHVATLPDVFSTYDNEWPALQAWFAEFDLVRELSPSASEDELYHQALALIDGIVAKKVASATLVAESPAPSAPTAEAAPPAAESGDAGAVPAADADAPPVAAEPAPAPVPVDAVSTNLDLVVEDEAGACAWLRGDGLLPQDLAKALHGRWIAVESEYSDNVCRVLNGLRWLRVQQSAYASRSATDFTRWCVFLSFTFFFFFFFFV
jgi:hypothetical protein